MELHNHFYPYLKTKKISTTSKNYTIIVVPTRGIIFILPAKSREF